MEETLVTDPEVQSAYEAATPGKQMAEIRAFVDADDDHRAALLIVAHDIEHDGDTKVTLPLLIGGNGRYLASALLSALKSSEPLLKTVKLVISALGDPIKETIIKMGAMIPSDREETAKNIMEAFNSLTDNATPDNEK